MQVQSIINKLNSLISNRPSLAVSPKDVSALYNLADDHGTTGCDVVLEEGEYFIERTVRLPSNTTIVGRGAGRTKLTLLPNSNCHVFTNAEAGGKNICCSQFSVAGNGDSQSRPPDWKPLTFACAFYFRNVESIICTDMSFDDIRQTALHFNNAVNIVTSGIRARKLGWSGVSTSNASNIWVEADVSDAGLDVMHSAIHMDGGVGVYVEARVAATTGNGIMLDSAFAPLRNCVVKGSASACKRGVSLSGAAETALENVAISAEVVRNREVGIMISNASNVTVMNSKIVDNGKYGILFQGRRGGSACNVCDTTIEGHELDVAELHASSSNWHFVAPLNAKSPPLPAANRRHLSMRLGKANDWFS